MRKLCLSIKFPHQELREITVFYALPYLWKIYIGYWSKSVELKNLAYIYKHIHIFIPTSVYLYIYLYVWTYTNEEIKLRSKFPLDKNVTFDVSEWSHRKVSFCCLYLTQISTRSRIFFVLIRVTNQLKKQQKRFGIWQ